MKGGKKANSGYGLLMCDTSDNSGKIGEKSRGKGKKGEETNFIWHSLQERGKYWLPDFPRFFWVLTCEGGGKNRSGR